MLIAAHSAEVRSANSHWVLTMRSKNCLKIVLNLAQNCLQVVPKLPLNCLKVPPKLAPSSIKVLLKLSSSCLKEVSKSCKSCVKMWQSFVTVVSLLSQVVPKLYPNFIKIFQSCPQLSSSWVHAVFKWCQVVPGGAQFSQVVPRNLYSYSYELWWVSVFDLAACSG